MDFAWSRCCGSLPRGLSLFYSWRRVACACVTYIIWWCWSFRCQGFHTHVGPLFHASLRIFHREFLFSFALGNASGVQSLLKVWTHVGAQKGYLGPFTHEPRVVAMKFWEPKRNCLEAVPTHLQNHVVWSRSLKCSVKPYVTGPSTKCFFNEFLFMRVLVHDKIE